MKYRVRVLRDFKGWMNQPFKMGEEMVLTDWPHRTKEGYLVECYGQGDFNWFKIGEDIEILEQLS